MADMTNHRDHTDTGSTLRRTIAAMTIAAAIAFGGAAWAAPQHTTHRDWESVITAEDGKPLCFAGSAPQKQEGNFTQRGKVLLLVTHRPAEKSFGTVSIQAGYTYKPATDVTVDIDGRVFTLFTDGSTAWVRDAKAERDLLAAMRAGRGMAVKGTSSRGTVTTDLYSLAGLSAALDAINAGCKAP
jgi:hypothetical protein